MLLAVTTRRLLLIDADGSAVGAGGIGAASSAGAAAGAAPPPQPQDGSAAQPVPQVLQVEQLLQQLFLQQCLWQWKMSSRPRWQQLFLQQLLQALLQPQAGSAAQPLLQVEQLLQLFLQQ